MAQSSNIPLIFSNPNIEFSLTLKSLAKYKERSHTTHTNTHIPELSFLPPNSTLDVVLIGHSMLERFKTTGTSTRIAQMPKSFNASVGGDKISSVLYRIDLGLLNELKRSKPKLWVVCVGTNDLRPKRPFGPDEITAYRILLQALLRIVPGSRALATTVTYRKDIPDSIVDASNVLLEGVGERINEECGVEVVRWLDKPELSKEVHLVDHVHFNEEGYRVWDEALFPVVEEMKVLPLIEFQWMKEVEGTGGFERRGVSIVDEVI